MVCVVLHITVAEKLHSGEMVQMELLSLDRIGLFLTGLLDDSRHLFPELFFEPDQIFDLLRT